RLAAHRAVGMSGSTSVPAERATKGCRSNEAGRSSRCHRPFEARLAAARTGAQRRTMPSVRDVAHTERQRVIAAVPNAGAARDAILELARLDAVAVACVAADPSVPWWRRRPRALSLEGQVPDALAATLWERIEDDGD